MEQPAHQITDETENFRVRSHMIPQGKCREAGNHDCVFKLAVPGSSSVSHQFICVSSPKALIYELYSRQKMKKMSVKLLREPQILYKTSFRW